MGTRMASISMNGECEAHGTSLYPKEANAHDEQSKQNQVHPALLASSPPSSLATLHCCLVCRNIKGAVD